jgi:hypothetical protein
MYILVDLIAYQLEVFREHIFHASCLRYVAHNFHLVVHMARTHSVPITKLTAVTL